MPMGFTNCEGRPKFLSYRPFIQLRCAKYSSFALFIPAHHSLVLNSCFLQTSQTFNFILCILLVNFLVLHDYFLNINKYLNTTADGVFHGFPTKTHFFGQVC